MKLLRTKRIHAVLSNGITLSGLSPSQLTEVKELLTFDNPQYATVKRFSKYATTNVPPFIHYYNRNQKGLTVPIGFSLTPYSVSLEDQRVYEKIKTAPFVLELRDTQKEAVQAYISQNESPLPKGCIQLPTGKGKSILGLYLASHYSCKTLIVVHKDDLVKGWNNDIKIAFDGKVNPGLLKAKSRRVGHFLTIATVQTLSRMKEDELQELFDTFGLVIQDEMHHCPASTFEVVSRFRSRYKLGLTATPERADGLSCVMTLYFGDFCYRYKNTKKDEDILPVEVITREVPFGFNPSCKVTEHRDGYKSYAIEDLLYPIGDKLPKGRVRLADVPYANRPKVQFQTIDDIVVRKAMPFVCKDILKEYQAGHSCIVFFSQKEHCRLYQEYLLSMSKTVSGFQKLLIPSCDIGLYYGDNKHNDQVFERAEKQRAFITLTTYAKATEGTNVKQWEVEFLVSSLNNGKNVEQAAGRVRRTTSSAKLDIARLYDYRYTQCYSISKHGNTRDARYRELKFNTPHLSYTTSERGKGLFSRGYR